MSGAGSLSSASHDTQADPGQRGRLPRRAGRRRQLLRRLSDQPLDRDPQHRVAATRQSTRSSASFRPRTRSHRRTRSSAPPWRAPRRSPPPRGPGFSLMQEAVGYAQKVGVPCVFVNVMRVGPATGMPTMPGQGDIMQVKWGSTGDYTPIAFYPNGVEEAFRVTVDAFNAAEESRSPVVILSDTFVAHLNEVVDLDESADAVTVVEREIAAAGRVHRPAPLLRRRPDVRARTERRRAGHRRCRRVPAPVLRRPSIATSRSRRATRTTSTAGTSTPTC